MNRVDIADRFAAMWRESREASGKSQEYVAKCLGVSKKTVQNWEQGLSSPNQLLGFMWFECIGQPALPYYLKLLYPDSFSDNDADIDKALVKMVTDLPPKYKKELMLMLSGKHGSSVAGLFEMLTAHLHAPLRERINVALSIATNYKIATVHNVDSCPNDIQPDIELLEQSIFDALDAVYKHESCYILKELNRK